MLPSLSSVVASQCRNDLSACQSVLGDVCDPASGLLACCDSNMVCVPPRSLDGNHTCQARQNPLFSCDTQYLWKLSNRDGSFQLSLSLSVCESGPLGEGCASSGFATKFSRNGSVSQLLMEFVSCSKCFTESGADCIADWNNEMFNHSSRLTLGDSDAFILPPTGRLLFRPLPQAEEVRQPREAIMTIERAVQERGRGSEYLLKYDTEDDDEFEGDEDFNEIVHLVDFFECQETAFGECEPSSPQPCCDATQRCARHAQSTSCGADRKRDSASVTWLCVP